MNKRELEEARRRLESWGLIVGPRDPQRNIAFRGRYMVAEPIDPELLPTTCARVGGYCIVGDNLAELIDQADGWFGIDGEEAE